MDVDIEKCIVQLIDHSTLNWQDFEGRSPLHLATANGNLRYGLLSSTVVLYGAKKRTILGKTWPHKSYNQCYV